MLFLCLYLKLNVSIFLLNEKYYQFEIDKLMHITENIHALILMFYHYMHTFFFSNKTITFVN